VAFVSSVPKIAGVVAFARVVQYLAPAAPMLWVLLVIAAVASMLVGNLAAYPQTDLRRLMAYSGVGHAGYLLVGLAAGARGLSGAALQLGSAGLVAAIFYSLAYAIPSMAVMLVVAQEGDALSDLDGLAKRRPWVAWVMVLLLMSLIGVPPLAGFTGKLFVFGSAVASGMIWLALFGVIMSAVSAGFYFRIIRAMFFGAAEAAPDGESPAVAEATPPVWSAVAAAMVVLCAVLVVTIGIWSGPLLSAIGLVLR
jgi:NADH-quinone oxidoreductase subunit N